MSSEQNVKSRLLMMLYRVAGYVLLVVVLPLVPLVWLVSSKRRANLFQRLGFFAGFKKKEADGATSKNRKRIWIHALSVGEVVSSVPLVKSVKEQFPEGHIVFTASTKTGFERACALLSDISKPLIDQIGYFPFDMGLCIRRVTKQIEPDVVILVETDLWPNFARLMQNRNIPIFLVNARLSERSLNGYLKFTSLFVPMFNGLTRMFVQSELDRQRYLKLGVAPSRIEVGGNIKFDQPIPQMDADSIDALKQKLGVDPEAQIIVAGSTHDPEEEILLRTFKALHSKMPEMRLILVPRDPERALNVVGLCRQNGIEAVLYSEMENAADKGRLKNNPEGASALVVDRMGVLMAMYALCNVAFVGGSLVEQGGHNPLEPAALSKPVVFGYDMTDFIEISKLLMDARAAIQVQTQEDLYKTLERVITDKVLQEQMGQKGLQLFQNHSGATRSMVKKISRLFEDGSAL